MKNLTIAILAAISLFSFTGCKKGGAAEAIKKMGEFKDKMCACKDKACADKVSEEMNKWGSEQKGDKEAKVSEDDAKKMAAVTEEFSKCMTKLMMGDMGGSAAGSGDMAGSAAGSGGAMAGSGEAGSAAGSGGAMAGSAAGSGEAGSAAGSGSAH